MVWGALVLAIAATPVEAASRRYVGTTTRDGIESRTTLAKVKWVVGDPGGTFTAKLRCRGGGCPAKGVGRVAGETTSYRFGGDVGGTVTFKRGLECRLSGSLYADDGVSLWENDQAAADAPRVVLTITCGDDVESVFVGAMP
jgi:hypothetical protein